MFSLVLPASLAWVVAGIALAQPVAACTGGTGFEWAVAHARGGILRAQIDSTHTREDQTSDLALSDLVTLRGNPPDATRVRAVAGLICEQTGDPNETVVILFDVRGGRYPYPIPLFYVIKGPDALGADEIAAALARLPPTDTVSSVRALVTSADRALLAAVAVAAAAGFSVAWRRFGTT